MLTDGIGSSVNRKRSPFRPKRVNFRTQTAGSLQGAEIAQVFAGVRGRNRADGVLWLMEDNQPGIVEFKTRLRDPLTSGDMTGALRNVRACEIPGSHAPCVKFWGWFLTLCLPCFNETFRDTGPRSLEGNS